jgi:hypothetical protein
MSKEHVGVLRISIVWVAYSLEVPAFLGIVGVGLLDVPAEIAAVFALAYDC